jgi:SAM-dependent methyltransferase
MMVLGVLVLAGCASNRGTPSPSVTDDKGSIASPRKPQNPAKNGPPAVLFVAFVETPQDIVDRMLRMARVTKNDVVYDLGCGDGRIVVTAARRYGCRVVGYDLDPVRVEEARRNAERNGVAPLVTIEQKDVLTVDLQGASVVTIYMGTEMNARLIPQLSKLPAGSRIVSHDFGLADIPPDKTVEINSRTDDRRHRIHLWHCPLPVEGNQP